MKKLAMICALVTLPANAQGLEAGNVLLVDACERHRLQIAGMARGKGTNSGVISEFVSWIKINTYVQTYNFYTNRFESHEEALQFILGKCAEDPTQTIHMILFLKWIDR